MSKRLRKIVYNLALVRVHRVERYRKLDVVTYLCQQITYQLSILLCNAVFQVLQQRNYVLVLLGRSVSNQYCHIVMLLL